MATGDPAGVVAGAQWYNAVLGRWFSKDGVGSYPLRPFANVQCITTTMTMSGASWQNVPTLAGVVLPSSFATTSRILFRLLGQLNSGDGTADEATFRVALSGGGIYYFGYFDTSGSPSKHMAINGAWLETNPASIVGQTATLQFYCQGGTINLTMPNESLVFEVLEITG